MNFLRVLLYLALGQKESYSNRLEFLRHTVKRVFRNPTTVATDGRQDTSMGKGDRGSIYRERTGKVLFTIGDRTFGATFTRRFVLR